MLFYNTKIIIKLLMEYLILAFFAAYWLTLALIRYQHLHEKISSDHDLSGPQKFHTHAVPRIGGIGIFLAITFTGLVTLLFFKLDQGLLLLQLMACALPAFLIGLLEDVTKKIGVKTRLAATACSAGLLVTF
jgi:UDP-GlcNAc:undecaprenyl-phosphate/decaprenyl-phosphate GlcNAc-1-phosphate transferase